MEEAAIPKKSLGQHWLHDTASLQAMCDAADVHDGDVVLEIGPGLGTLTDVLLQRKAEVTALEYDETLTVKLTKKYANHPSIQIVQGDIRTYDFGNMPEVYKIVANIPYYLTANLMRILTDESTHKPTRAALLVQKEVAERVAARPGDMAFLSVAAQFYYEVSLDALVPAELFTPPPKVDSQILVLNRREMPLFTDVDSAKFFRLAKAGFAARRKKLRSSLSAGLHISKPAAEQLLAKAGISPDLRAQALSLEDWYAIYKVYTES